MGTAYRVFLFQNDGRLRHISKKLSDKLRQGEAALPEYAGQTLRYVYVYLILENRKPVEIEDICAGKWRFDQNGSIHDSVMKAARLIFAKTRPRPYPQDPSSKVLDVKSKFLGKQYINQFTWKPSKEDIEKIKNMIWKPKKKRPPRKVVKLPATKKLGRIESKDKPVPEK